MKIEIVSHCWRYSRLLRYQLSSLYLHPPSTTEVTATVFCAGPNDDPATWQVVQSFLEREAPPRVILRHWGLPKRRLVRRAIGRNLAAKSTKADWVWFADCDMMFGDGAFDVLAERLTSTTADLAFPRHVMIHRTHQLGDMAILRAECGAGLIEVPADQFVPKKYPRAIGGVQIVRGRTARNMGYCPQRRWQRPANRWSPTWDDVAFRRMLGTKGTPIEVPNVYRIRHSVRGEAGDDIHL